MRNVSDKSCRENKNTHFIFNNFFLFENRAVIEIIWKNAVHAVSPQVTIWRMRIAYWILEATDAYSEYTIGLCIAFPLQQWFTRKRLNLRYTYIACLRTSENKRRKVHVVSRIYVAQA